MIERLPDDTLWLYWEGPMPPYVALCINLLATHTPNARLVGHGDLRQLGMPQEIIDGIDNWHVCHRADAIRAYLLMTYGGIWCDADCIPMRSFAPLLELAKRSPAGIAAYDSTGNTIGNGFMAARPKAPAICRLWQHIQQVIKENRAPGWLEVGSQPLTEIVRDIGRENFALWPLLHISPVPWHETERLLQTATPDQHRRFMQGFPAAWCWMLCNQKLTTDYHIDQWTRHEALTSQTLISELFRESLRRTKQPQLPRGNAVATLNVHGDALPHNFRESMRHAAARWGAEFVEITRPIVPWRDPMWEKLNLDRHLAMYERVVYLDRDVVVRADCPNLFDLVPPDAFGIVPSEQEGHGLLHHIEPAMRQIQHLTSLNLDLTTEYYNSGVMIFSPQRHAAAFDIARLLHPLASNRGWEVVDQGLFSAALKITETKIERLPATYNRCGSAIWDHWRPCMTDYIWHFCGQKNWHHMAETQWNNDHA